MWFFAQAAACAWRNGGASIPQVVPAGIVTRIGMMTQKRPLGWRQMPGLAEDMADRKRQH